MIMQKGGYFLSDDGFDLSHPAVEDVIGFAAKLYYGVERKDDYRGQFAEQIAFRFCSPSELNFVPDSDRFYIAPVPTFGAQMTTSYGRLYLAVRKSTPEEERASWELIKWISRRDVAMPKGWGGYPARKDFIEREDFKARAASGIQNLEVLYQANEHTISGGDHLLGRSDGIWIVFNFIGAYSTLRMIRDGRIDQYRQEAASKEQTANQEIRRVPPPTNR